MVNNNTPKTTVTVAKVSESDIYVKQSDLEKMTLGSFKNDMGYISSSALALWMKEHFYLSKNEINALINKANLVVIDSINKQYDEDALRILDEKVNDMAGEIVAIKDRLADVEGSFISVDKEGLFATKGDIRIINTKIQNITTEISSIDLSNLATKAEIPVIPEIPSKVSQLENDKGYLTKHQSLVGYAKKTDIPDFSKFVKKDELPATPTGLASQQWVKDQGYLKEHQSLKGYAKKTDLNGLASKEWVEELLDTPGEIDLSGYAKTTDLNKLASTVTSISSSLKSYAKKSDLNLDDYAKTSSLSKYQLKDKALTMAQVDQKFISNDEIKNYLKSDDAASTYMTISDVQKDYLRIEDYRGLRNMLDAVVLNRDFINMTEEEFKSEIKNMGSYYYP